MESLHIQIGKSFKDVVGFEGEWDKLLLNSKQNYVFLSEGWISAWYDTIGFNSKLLIATVKSKDELIAAVAFQDNNGVIEFAGKGPSDYSDFIISKSINDKTAATSIALILNSIRKSNKRFKFFHLGRIPYESDTIKYLINFENEFFTTIVRYNYAPYMEMKIANEKTNKKSIRRHENSLKRLGAVTDITFSKANDILPLIDTLFAQHISRWEEKGTPSIFLNQINREFYLRFVNNLDKTKWLRFTILKLDEKIIATHLGFSIGGRYIWYKPSFDIKLKNLSPGEVLIKRLIEQAKSEESNEIDFTIGQEAFKFRFANKIRKVVYIHVTDSWLRAYTKRVFVFFIQIFTNCIKKTKQTNGKLSF